MEKEENHNKPEEMEKELNEKQAEEMKKKQKAEDAQRKARDTREMETEVKVEKEAKQKKATKKTASVGNKAKGGIARVKQAEAGRSKTGATLEPRPLASLLQHLLPAKRKWWQQWADMLVHEGLETDEDVAFLAPPDFEALRVPLVLKSALRALRA
jgi:hypothetical protein